MIPKKISTLQSTSGLVAAAALLVSCGGNDGYKKADTNEDGRVGPAEFERYMLETIFALSDSNKDSKVTFEEWKVANPGAIASKFKVPDKNRDGAVTPSEAKAHFERQGTIDDLFAKIDSGRDGYLDQNEVRAFMKELDAQTGTALEKLSRATSKKSQ